jgi:hypothetical protein
MSDNSKDFFVNNERQTVPTYRGHVQALVADLDESHAKAGAMLDHSTDEEKQVFYQVRAHLVESMRLLNHLDNNMIHFRAQLPM